MIAPDCPKWWVNPESHKPDPLIGVYRPHCGCGKCKPMGTRLTKKELQSISESTRTGDMVVGDILRRLLEERLELRREALQGWGAAKVLAIHTNASATEKEADEAIRRLSAFIQ